MAATLSLHYLKLRVIVVQSLCLYLLVVLLPSVAVAYFSREAVVSCASPPERCLCAPGSSQVLLPVM